MATKKGKDMNAKKFRSNRRKMILVKIKLYRERGASYQEIADAFNSEGIETLYPGKNWHKSSVFNLNMKYNKK